MIKENMAKQLEYQKANVMMNPQFLQGKLDEQTTIIQQLLLDNSQLQDKVKYLESKINKLINELVQERLQNKEKL
jgi:hypothetical protein